MGKYFSNDSDLVNYQADLGEMSVDMTKPTNIHQPQQELSSYQKEMLSTPATSPNTPTLDDKIEEVHQQNEEIKEHFEQIDKARVKQTFKSFDELEVLERLNQITFLLVEQNDRISRIESFLKGHTTPIEQVVETETPIQQNEIDLTQQEPTDISQMSPTERHIMETQEKKEVNLTNINDVKKELNRIQSGNPPSIPDEGFIDNGVNLEELIPDRDPEAYQNAYKALDEAQKRSPNVGYSKSPKGGLSGANAGF